MDSLIQFFKDMMFMDTQFIFGIEHVGERCGKVIMVSIQDTFGFGMAFNMYGKHEQSGEHGGGITGKITQ